jgi:small-conductance mechanosensitive channel
MESGGQEVPDVSGAADGDPATSGNDETAGRQTELFPFLVKDPYSGFPALIKAVMKNCEDIYKKLSDIRNSIDETSELMGILVQEYEGMSDSPHVREDVLSQLKGLKRTIDSNITALGEKSLTLGQKINEMAKRKASISVSTAARPDDWTQTESSLEAAELRAKGISENVRPVLEEGRKIIDKLNGYIAEYSPQIPEAWKEYYLEQSGVMNSRDWGRYGGMSGLADAFYEWVNLTVDKKKFLYPQDPDGWLQSLTSFVLIGLPIALVGFLLHRGSRLFPVEPVNWRVAIMGIVRGPWRYLTVGVALANASRNHLGGNYIVFFIPGVLILIWGLASTSWKLRLAAKSELAGVKSPLRRFYVPAVLGVLFLFADVPTGALSIIWFVVLMLFLFNLFRISKRSREDEELKGFLLERFAYGSAYYFAIISFIISAVGFPRLAVLAFMLLFTVVNVLILGNAFVVLGTILCDRIFPKDVARVRNSILNAFLVPVTWSISLLCTFPWLWAIPGSTTLMENLLTTGYSVGQASFNLTRVLLILGLFFLFRSLRTLGSTSLENLPDEIELSPAQIDPIKTLMTYVIWITFVMVAMGLLGFNWTTLTVVLGAIGAGLGFGLQGIFANLVGGVLLVFGRSLKVGDFVEIGAYSGTVRRVDLRCTEIETLDGSIAYIPNYTIVSTEYVKWTREGEFDQVLRTLVIRAFYGTNIDLALELILGACSGIAEVLDFPAPEVVLNDLNEKYLEFNLFITVKPVSRTVAILSGLRVRIEKSFYAHGIKLYRQSLEINVREALDGIRSARESVSGTPAKISQEACR